MKRSFIYIAAIVFSLIISCKPVYNPPVSEEVPSLAQKYADYFPIGSMITQQDVDNASDTIIKHCSMVTVNQFYFGMIHPEENFYRWDTADSLISFANSNGMKTRGHTLIWGYLNPEWLFIDNNNTVSKEVLTERMRQHIHTVVSRYKGRVDCWDVVNEATADIYHNLGAEPSSICDTYKKNRWQQIIGDEYVELAFRFAHEADPDAKLFYNDYNVEGIVNKAKIYKAYKIVKDLLAKGVPVHGVGIQGHWSIDMPGIDSIIRTIDLFSSLGVEVQITELDLTVYSQLRWLFPGLFAEYEAFTEDMSLRQSERYYKLFSALRSRKNKLTGVVFWGLSDDTSWLRRFPDERNDWPLLFDGRYEPKKAFWAVVDF